MNSRYSREQALFNRRVNLAFIIVLVVLGIIIFGWTAILLYGTTAIIAWAIQRNERKQA